MTSYYIWVLIFGPILYLALVDANVAYALVLILRIVKIRYERTKWWVFNNPQMPWAKYLIWRRSLRIAKVLEKEFKN
jgi:hypothetical protein